MGYMYAVVNDDYLAHHGVKGQKWGVRRYQNADGSYTDEGRSRYGEKSGKKGLSTGAKVAIALGGTAAIAGGLYAFSRSKAGRKLIANGVNRLNGMTSAMDSKISSARAQRLMDKGALGVKNNGQKFFDAADNVTNKFNAREMARAKSLAKVGAAANDSRSMGQLIKSDFSNLGTGAKNAYNKAGAGVKDAYNRVGAKVSDAVEGVKSKFASMQGPKDYVASRKSIRELRKLDGADLGSRMSDMAGNVGQGVKNVSGKVGEAFKTAGGKVGQGVKTAGGKVGEAFKTAGGKVGQGVKTAGGKVGEAFKTAGGKVGQGFGSYKDSLSKDIGILRDTGSVVGKQIKKFPGQAKEYGVRRASNVLKTTTGSMVGSRMKNISKAGKITAAVGTGLGVGAGVAIPVATSAAARNRRRQAYNR